MAHIGSARGLHGACMAHRFSTGPAWGLYDTHKCTGTAQHSKWNNIAQHNIARGLEGTSMLREQACPTTCSQFCRALVVGLTPPTTTQTTTPSSSPSPIRLPMPSPSITYPPTCLLHQAAHALTLHHLPTYLPPPQAAHALTFHHLPTHLPPPSGCPCPHPPSPTHPPASPIRLPMPSPSITHPPTCLLHHALHALILAVTEQVAHRVHGITRVIQVTQGPYRHTQGGGHTGTHRGGQSGQTGGSYMSHTGVNQVPYHYLCRGYSHCCHVALAFYTMLRAPGGCQLTPPDREWFYEMKVVRRSISSRSIYNTAEEAAAHARDVALSVIHNA